MVLIQVLHSPQEGKMNEMVAKSFEIAALVWGTFPESYREERWECAQGFDDPTAEYFSYITDLAKKIENYIKT